MRQLSIAAAIFILTVSAPAAWAGPCQDDIAKIDAAIGSKDLAADIRAQAEDMRNQAVQLCGAGNEEEGLAVTSEAKALLAVE